MGVMQLSFILKDEDTGEVLAHKMARLHDGDPAAGEYLIAVKQKEVALDIAHWRAKRLAGRT